MPKAQEGLLHRFLSVYPSVFLLLTIWQSPDFFPQRILLRLWWRSAWVECKCLPTPTPPRSRLLRDRPSAFPASISQMANLLHALTHSCSVWFAQILRKIQKLIKTILLTLSQLVRLPNPCLAINAGFIHSLLRLTSLCAISAADEPPSKKRRSTRQSASTQSSSSTTKSQVPPCKPSSQDTHSFGAQLTVFDVHRKCLLTDGDYEIIMNDLRPSQGVVSGNRSKSPAKMSAKWENAPLEEVSLLHTSNLLSVHPLSWIPLTKIFHSCPHLFINNWYSAVL